MQQDQVNSKSTSESNQRVLLVDDNPTNLQVLAQTLDGQDLDLLIARHGEEALEIAARAQPALILLDINMPGMGGFETCKRLKKDPVTEHMVVIFLSASKDTHDKLQGFELGAADYISKPFNVEEVVARVNSHLEDLQNRQGQSPEAKTRPAPAPGRSPLDASPSQPMARTRVLLVDDNTDNLNVLSQTLDGEGFDMLVARSGEEALKVASSAKPALVLLDIMMPPGMDGYETCQRLKADPETGDIAIIFMSALDAVADKVRGFEAGGVDYISKPFQAEEVRARVRTQLGLIQARTALQAAHDRMKQDLEAAAKIQNKLLPHELPASAAVSITWEYRPCDELAGDFLNIFRVTEREIAIYIVDVMGHGVPAALFAFSVSLHLNSSAGPNSILFDANSPTGTAAPAVVLSRLNERFPLMADEGRYFTLLYGLLDTETHSFRCANAGHPCPLLVTPEQPIREIDISGNPIGLLKAPEFDETTVQLNPGDRIYLYSDGLEEERNPSGESFGLERISETLKTNAAQSLKTSVEHLIQSVLRWHESDHLDDDVSLIGLEITGKP
jgi:phosphoserine phosphatase RsbU/P